MATYRLSLLTPDGKIFDGEIESLSAPGAYGSFGVLACHAPMVCQLSKGVLKIKAPPKEFFVTVWPGALEVDAKGNVLVLVDKAVLS